MWSISLLIYSVLYWILVGGSQHTIITFFVIILLSNHYIFSSLTGGFGWYTIFYSPGNGVAAESGRQKRNEMTR